MKKLTKYLIIIAFCGAFLGITIPFTLVIFDNTPTSTQSTHVQIIVNSTIHDQIFPELSQYKQDIINQGYTADIVAWSDLNITKLRNHLINISQQTSGLFGAVLIGDLPVAIIENYDAVQGFGLEIFPSDLYLMDLDGQWTDNDIDNDFESHTAGLGDIYPDIWIGRINPECLNNLNHIQAYQDYFDRNHAYRTGNLSRPHSQLIYIDDHWTGDAAEWIGDITGYNNKTSIYTPTTSTNEVDYTNRLTQYYEFVHLFVHSDYEKHWFGPWGLLGSEGFLNYTEVLNLHTKPLFYNLFACSASLFTVTNNIGTQYLFSNNTLVVIGTTKTGGMTMNSFFYNPLRQGKIFGEAFRLWYWNDDGIVSHGPDDPWSMGMTLLGDPLLTIHM
jgi:hypothetical protein